MDYTSLAIVASLAFAAGLLVGAVARVIGRG